MLASRQTTMFLKASTNGKSRKIAIAVARFNSDITEALLNGALHTLSEAGVSDTNIDIARVPGAFELPLICREMALTGRYNAIIALGCVIQGETPHFQFISGECASGCMQTGLETGIPVIFGVLTADTLAQAQLRSDSKIYQSSNVFDKDRQEKTTPKSNKGSEAALAALELASLLDQIQS